MIPEMKLPKMNIPVTDLDHLLQRESRRRKFAKRTKRKKRKCFSYVFKHGLKQKSVWWAKIIKRICSRVFWFGMGILALMVSWELLWRMGETSFFDSRLAGEKDLEEDEEMRSQGENWIQEFLGVEVRFRDGKIIFFRERKGESAY